MQISETNAFFTYMSGEDLLKLINSMHSFFQSGRVLDLTLSILLSRSGCNFRYLPLWKKCQYTASSWHELEKTPPLDLEICLSRDNAPFIPSELKIPASANLTVVGGRIFQYIPPLSSVLFYSPSQEGSPCFTNYKNYWSSGNQTTHFGRCFE